MLTPKVTNLRVYYKKLTWFIGRQISVKLPELGDYPFNFPSVCWNVPEPSPIVGLDREISECEKTKNSSTSIANEYV